ncbi:hypothetical protein ACH474_02300 [Nocardia rhamnosiphila]|uniref:Uncharacterized protein n=1 Tax=Nocardia rhamnosiphila TaxID=426716 RepID=A0ABV2WJW5_9NOCA|nr:hypothetical protein [Nocardia rhamnosiphila]
MPVHTVPRGVTAGAGLVELARECTGSTSIPDALRAHLTPSDERKRGNFNSFIENKGNFNSFIVPTV